MNQSWIEKGLWDYKLKNFILRYALRYNLDKYKDEYKKKLK